MIDRSKVQMTKLILSAILDIFILSGSAFLCVKYDWSIWTLALGVILCFCTYNHSEANENKND